MTIIVSGKNIDLGEALREYVLGRLEQAVGKYFSRPVSGHVAIEKSRGAFQTACSLHLHSGFDVQTSGSAHDAYASVDDAAEKLEKQLRRYKRRLKNHHAGTQGLSREINMQAIDYVIERQPESDSDEDSAEESLSPPIIAEQPATIRQLTVTDAVMQLDLSDSQFVIFRNASHGQLNVIYRRPDGNIGWIDAAGALSKQD